MKSLITVTSRVFVVLLGCSIFISTSIFAALPGHDKREFTSDFDCPGDLYASKDSAYVKNKYFPLVPGSSKFYSSVDCDDCEEVEEVLITVTHNGALPALYASWFAAPDYADYAEYSPNPSFGDVTTRMVMEEEWEDGTMIEVSFNYFAICEATGDVFYFGEEVVNLDDGGEPLVDMNERRGGSWRHGEVGEDGEATAGMIMPGSFMLGARYFQEYFPGGALDRGENVAMGLAYGITDGEDVWGVNEECVQVNDTNALEDPKGKEFDEKIYCAGIGLAMDEDMALCETAEPIVVEGGVKNAFKITGCIEEVEEED